MGVVWVFFDVTPIKSFFKYSSFYPNSLFPSVRKYVVDVVIYRLFDYLVLANTALGIFRCSIIRYFQMPSLGTGRGYRGL